MAVSTRMEAIIKKMNREPININETPVSCLNSNNKSPDSTAFSAYADRNIYTKPSIIDSKSSITAVYISHGMGRIVHCGFEHQLKSGTVFILDEKKRLDIFPTSPVVIYSCAFVPELFGEKSRIMPMLNDISSDPVLKPFFQVFDGERSSWRIPSARRETVQALFYSMIDCIKLSPVIRDSVIRLRISELLIDLADITSEESNTAVPAVSETISQVIAYLRRNYAEKISCDELASLVCVSRSKLFSDFRAATGKTIGKYIEELRISKAASLLVSTNDTVYNIMYEVGYRDMKMFCRRFKEQMNTTPSEYRKTNR